MQILLLAMIVLAAFTPYAIHMDRVDRIKETENNQLGSATKNER